jgi:NAD(P)-dependent dehydrogenase (short-subunit alcohol dehydrogenase family)
MKLNDIAVLLTGGASGLGLATAQRLAEAGAEILVVDLPSSNGVEAVANLGPTAQFVSADVTDEKQLEDALSTARLTKPLRAVVHTAGRGRPQRILAKDGTPGSLEAFSDVITVNVIGTYNVLRLAASRIAAEPDTDADSDRGAIVLTSSVAAFEGQIGQIAYATSKAAIAGMTICAARDLASRGIRVCTIAPGIFDTPLMAKTTQQIRDRLAAVIPNPRRMGEPAEYALLAQQILENPYLNGETIRLDGAVRLGAY